jgi:3'-phosphoadenosine 5'-phosphosulfate sulfotransferase (PAPS reductase)/FAD synthetase
MVPFFFKLNVKSSFRVKCISESIEAKKRLVCIDFLYKSGPAIDWSTIFIHTIYLFSKNWQVIKGTEKIMKRDGILMIYVTIQEMDVPEVEGEAEFLAQSRKCRSVNITESNTLSIDDSTFDVELSGLLKHENEELKAEANAD